MLNINIVLISRYSVEICNAYDNALNVITSVLTKLKYLIEFVIFKKRYNSNI